MPKLNPGATLLNQYQIVNYVSSTRWGEKYKAVRLADQRSAEIQCLDRLAGINKSAVDLVFSVTEKMVGIVHKHIVEVFGFGVDPSSRVPFVAQAWTEGQVLADLMLKKYPVGAPPATVRRIVTPVAVMLDDVQDSFFHGFLNPKCIYVSSIGRVKVSEFGWMSVCSAHMDQGALLEPADRPYLAPEYSRTKPDHRADVHSLAMISHVLLSGRPALPDGTPELKAETPQELVEAVQGGLLPDPELRYPTAGALLEAMRISLLGQKKASKSMMMLDLLRTFAEEGEDKKYMVQKGRLDYGPYSGQEIREKLCDEEILPEHVVVTITTGLRKKALQHPDFTDFVQEYQRRMELKRREAAEKQTTVSEKRQSRTLKLTVVLGLAVLAAVALSIVLYQSVTKETGGRGKRAIGSEQDLAVETDVSTEMGADGSMKAPGARKKRTKSGGGGGGGGYSGEEIKVYALDNLELPRSVINSVVNRDVIMQISGACIPPTGVVVINYQVDGRRGRIRFTSASLDREPNNKIASCAHGILKNLEFPVLDTDLSGSGSIRY
jgi:serine/threonine protein kinase